MTADRFGPEDPGLRASQAARIDRHSIAAEGLTRPFMRRIDHSPFEAPGMDPLSSGWVAEPAGLWAGQEVEVVYDFRRYNVMLTYATGPDITTALEADGWERCAVDGARTFWIRDRLAATRNVLARLDQAALGLDQDSPGLDRAPIDRGELAL